MFMLNSCIHFKSLFLYLFFCLSISSVLAQDSLLIKYKQAIVDNKPDLQCKFSIQLAKFHAFKGHADSAILYAQKAFDAAVVVKDSNTQIKSANIIGLKALQKGENKKALNWFNKGIEIASLKKDTLLLANLLLNKSMIYSTVGSSDYPKALSLLIEAAKLNESAKAWNSLPANYKSISIVCKEIGDSVGRDLYLKKALKLIADSLVTNLSTQAIVYNEMGRYYTEEKIDYTQANAYYDKVLAICKNIGWKRGISVSLTNKAEVLTLQEKYSDALELHQQVLTLKKGANDISGIVNSQLLIGEMLIKQKKYSTAISHLQKAKDLAEQSNKTNSLKNIHLALYSAYQALGNYKTSLFHHEKYSLLSDSINSIQHTEIIEELKTKYETDKKEQRIKDLTFEQEITALKSEKKVRNYVIIISFLISIIGAILLIARQNRIKSKEQETQLNQKLLRTQMNPHFIFNSLNSINTYITGNKAAEAGLFLSKFAKLMRNILESSRNESITLEQEITTLNYYLQLEKLRFNNNFNYEISCSDDTDQDDIEIPPMLIQPFIENAIKHGLKHCDGSGFIGVDFKMSNESTLVCTVRDNGIGISQNKNEDKHHISYATDITRERIHVLNKKYKKKISLNIIDLSSKNSKGTCIEIVIPV